jgi:hypothetical protein
MHEIKVDSNDERHVLGFEANLTNVLNQHAVTSIYGGINSAQLGTALMPGIALGGSGAAAYKAFESGYSIPQYINGPTSPVTLSSQYGQPFTYQLSRTIRFKVRYTF